MAVMAPIRQGQRLTRRSAVKVVLSRALPRSASARVAACQRLRMRWSSVSGASAVCLIGMVRVACSPSQVGQHGVGGVGPLGQQRQHAGVGAQGSGVVLAAGRSTAASRRGR